MSIKDQPYRRAAALARRKKRAEEWLDFWMHEYAKDGDDAARLQLAKARESLSAAASALAEVSAHGCICYPVISAAPAP